MQKCEPIRGCDCDFRDVRAMCSLEATSDYHSALLMVVLHLIFFFSTIFHYSAEECTENCRMRRQGQESEIQHLLKETRDKGEKLRDLEQKIEVRPCKIVIRYL